MNKREGEEATATKTKKQDQRFPEKKDVKQYFCPSIFDDEFKKNLTHQIATSEPYRWGSIFNLIDDTLLRQVRKEVELQIHFTKKETDIYKVFQSGDLANLSGLDWDDLSRLPSLFKLREAIYSQEFRSLVSQVTGAGKLSGVKTDMSVNTYTKGCHLLTHDDVIGSRRVSFILYLPDPDKVWKEHYGGALRLFPALIPNVPHTDYSTKFIPQFNQIAFFTVQPGLSFHDVEEVRIDKQRLSIQGWYHIPQRGEDGFIEGEQEATEAKSTLQALESKELEEYDFPKEIRIPFNNYELKGYENLEGLSKDDLKYLSKYVNPEYLTKNKIQQLKEKFVRDNVIELEELLNEEISIPLKKIIRSTELDEVMPQHSNEVKFPWKISTPPHKWRYLYVDGKQPEPYTVKCVKRSNLGPQELPNFELVKHTTENETTIKLIDIASFIRSIAFRKWLRLVTDLIPTSDQVLVRRFRPGHDFKLATTISTETGSPPPSEAILEATLNLTPSKGWETGEFGGYELSMVNEQEDEDDPAIYKASGDDDVLLNTQACWNKLVLMVRDPSVLKFVKYVSFNAKGNRWDITAQWDIKQDNEEDDDDNELEKNDHKDQ